MVSPDLVAALHDLSRADKFYILQLLITELAQDDSTPAETNTPPASWATYDPVEAANTLLQALQDIEPPTVS